MSKIRLDRFLANAHIGTRSEVKRYIREKRIKVNGTIVTDSSIHISDSDIVTFDDKPVTPHREVYIVFYKPSGFVSTTSEDEPSVLNLIDHPYVNELHIVGRLDKDVEGLLILTNDGEFTHKLISPKKHVEKEYYITFPNKIFLTDDMKKKVENGIYIEPDIKTLPGKIEQIDEKTISITIVEGKYHQIKKMCKSLGLSPWERITRVRIGNLTLSGLEKGMWKEMKKEEIYSAIFG